MTRLVTLFKRLIAILTGDDTSNFADFFRQDRHIGQLAEVTYAVHLDPVVYPLLEVS